MEMVWIIDENIKIFLVEMCFDKGFLIVLYLFKLIVMRVSDEEVESVVWNGYKILYILLLNG